MTQKELGEILGISRQRVWVILNSNEEHKDRKLKRIKIVNYRAVIHTALFIYR